MLRVAVVGATGYTGYEVLRLLQLHPHVDVVKLFSTQHAGTDVSSIFPSAHGLPKTFSNFDPDIDYEFDCLFLAVPHVTTHHYMAKLVSKSYRIIDLSADFRLSDDSLFNETYSVSHKSPSLLTEVPYGIPELYADDIAHAKIVANPGCYATTAILGLYPLSQEGFIDHVVIDAKSGVSGAGRSLKKDSMYCEANEHVSAYATNTHRHQAELAEHLGVPLVFSPHLIPMSRGIMCSSYVQSSKPSDEDSLLSLYNDVYKDCPFVTVHVQNKITTAAVVGSNRVDISIVVANGQICIFSVSDNLIKGAAGQAIQNMNVMFGLSQELGLPILGQLV